MDPKLKTRISKILEITIGVMIVIAIAVSFETIYEAGKDFGSNVTKMILSLFN